MILWPRWLDRIYWRWYLRRHPYHLVCPTIQFTWHRLQRGLVDAFELTVEEFGWLADSTVAETDPVS